jgi:hypothetical protein
MNFTAFAVSFSLSAPTALNLSSGSSSSQASETDDHSSSPTQVSFPVLYSLPHLRHDMTPGLHLSTLLPAGPLATKHVRLPGELVKE